MVCSRTQWYCGAVDVPIWWAVKVVGFLAAYWQPCSGMGVIAYGCLYNGGAYSTAPGN